MNLPSRPPLGLAFVLGVFPLLVTSQLLPTPRLDVRIGPNDEVVLRWNDAQGPFLLEESDRVGERADWRAIESTPRRESDFASISLPATGAERFFRLRARSSPPAPALTRVVESSPEPGENGVAVTRETIFRLSAPLAATTRITIDDLHAEFGGRRILSRPELSSDRRTLTLFHLEPLPAAARLRVVLDGSRIFDDLGNLADFDGDGRPGGRLSLDFETVGITPIPGTAVAGRVFASEPVTGADGKPSSVNRPLGGVIITVDGAEQTLRAVTDPQGNFKLQPAPAGHFFVHVDGRQAVGSSWPNGAYYPVVGKAWEAVAGRQDNRAGGTGEIYLPLVPANTLQPVSPTRDTPITFPAAVLQANPGLAGVSITVPANSLYSDNGTRGGKVGIAPVPPDRLPEKLPPGLNFPLVITVQTDGPGNFDRPVPVRFPNLPDPQTGRLLPPGARTALWSFNHDTGRWEIQGSMTVSADGKFVDSDPGVGIRQPGWHSSAPATAASLGGPLPMPTSSIVGGPMLCPTTPAAPVAPPAPPPPAQWIVTVDTASGAPINPLPQNQSASETIYVGPGHPLAQAPGLHATVCTVAQGPGGPATITTPASPARSQGPRPARPGPVTPPQVSFRQTTPGNPTAWQQLDGTSYLLVKDADPFALEFANNDTAADAPDLFVTVDVEGLPDEFLNGLSSGAFIVPPGQKTVITASAKPLAHRTNPQNASHPSDVIARDQLFLAKVKIEATELAAPFRGLIRQEFYVMRYFDASDPFHADGILDFQKTSPAGPTRERGLDVHGDHLFPAPLAQHLVVPSSAFALVDDDRGRRILFQPAVEGKGLTATATLKDPRGQVAGTLRLRGDSDTTKYFLDAAALFREIESMNAAPENTVTVRADQVYDAIRAELQRVFIAQFPSRIEEASSREEADILIDTFSARSQPPQGLSDAAPFVITSNGGRAYVKDFDLGFDPALGASPLTARPHLNDAQFAFVLSRAVNRRFSFPGKPLDRFEEEHVEVGLGGFFVSGTSVTGWGANIGRQIARAIGFHLGMMELWEGVDAHGSLTRQLIDFSAIDCNLQPTFPSSDFVHPTNERYPLMTLPVAGFNVCESYAWRTTMGRGTFAELERTLAYYLDYTSFGVTGPADPDFFGTAYYPRPQPGPGLHIAGGKHAPARSIPLPATAMAMDPTTAQPIIRTDFGSVAVGVGGISRVFALANLGQDPLTVREIRLQTRADFALLDGVPPGTVIPGGGTVAFRLRFDPRSAGTHLGSILFLTDGTNPNLILHVSGSGMRQAGALAVNIRHNNAGPAVPGSESISLPESITLKNTGPGPLRVRNIQMVTGAQDFSITGRPTPDLSLAPGDAVRLDLAFHPTRLGLLSGTVEITTDDPDRPVVRIPVCGTGVPAGAPSAEWGLDHVLIEAAGSASRLQSDARGDFFAYLPADQPYTVRVFDPVSGLVWFGAGLSAPAGQATSFGIPVFRASTANDNDLDGLPDDINRILGAGWRFDFGTAASPVAAGHHGISPDTRHTESSGYGWLSGAVTAVDGGPSNAPALTRDWNATADGAFAVDVPNGTFEVTATFAPPSSDIQLLLEGQYRGLASPATSGIPSQTFRVTIGDGQLNVGFRSTTGATAALAALTVRMIEDGVPPTPPSPVAGRILAALQDRTEGTVARSEFELLPGATLPSNIVANGRPFRQWFVEASTYRVGYRDFDAARPGLPLVLPDVLFGPSNAPDSDGDGLDDIVEFVAGTDSNRSDSDGDGLTDKAELDQGSDPLDPTPRGLGIIGLAPMTGAVDLAADNGMAAVVSQAQGGRLSLFNVFGDLPPVLVAAVPLRGFTSTRVALTGSRAIVAEQSFGAEVVDLSDPASPVVRHHFEEGVEAVAAAGPVAFLGTTTGDVVAFDLDRGFPISRAAIGASVQDLAVEGGRVVAIGGGRLHVLRTTPGVLNAGGNIEIPPDSTRVALQGGVAFVVHPSGFNTYNVTDPSGPVRIATAAADRANWLDLALNGSGLAIGVGGSATDADLLVYNVADPSKAGQFVAEIQTPDQSRAVAVLNGLAYAVGSTGLSAIRYLGPDSGGKPPSIALNASFPLEQASVEERTPLWIGATVTDDVQVRQVEFLIDGEVAATDGSAPFEYHFQAPLRVGRTSFRVQARAVDTGGNSSTTPDYPVTLLPDRTAPETWLAMPSAGARIRDYLPRVVVAASEPIDPSRLPADAVSVYGPGPDGQIGTNDDLPVPVAPAIWQADSRTLAVPLGQTPLRNGLYRALVKPGLRDLAGNGTAKETSWTFTIDDTTGPRIVELNPAENERVITDLTEVAIRFDEPLNPATLTAETLTLSDAGPDGLLETADDIRIAPAEVRYRAEDFTARLLFAKPLNPQRYLARVAASVANYNDFPMGRRSTQDWRWRFSVEVRTTVGGTVVRADGSPATSAIVTLTGFPGTTRTDAQGRFTLAGVAVPPGSRVAVTAQSIDAAGNRSQGRATHILPVHAGQSDAGTLRLEPVCEPRFDSNAFAPTALVAPVRAFAIFDDGTGSTVYAASGSELRRWNGAMWERIPGLFSDPSLAAAGFFLPAELLALAVYDDGSGPALYAGGRFQTVDGVPANGLARWNGKSWSAVSPALVGLASFGTTMPAVVSALTIYNDGSRSSLVVGGSFTLAGAVPSRDLARWNGREWSSIGSVAPFQGTSDRVRTMATLRIGNRTELYVAGDFNSIAGVACKGFARWDGTTWTAMDAGTAAPETGLPSGVIQTLTRFNDGQGDALYAGGIFESIGGAPAVSVARWNGQAWSALGTGLTSNGAPPQVRSLAIYDDGTGPGLYVCGEFDRAGSALVRGIARWDGREWSSLGRSNADAVIPAGSGYAEAMIGFNAGPSPALFVGASDAVVADGDVAVSIPGQFSMRWTGREWLPAGGDLSGPVDALALLDDANGPALIAGGRFEYASGRRVRGIARREGNRWVPLGDGFGGQVEVLQVFHHELYAAGRTSTPDGAGQVLLAKWNGTTWTRIAQENSGDFGKRGVQAMAAFVGGSSPALYAGGSFTTLQGVEIGGVARWNGSEWSEVGNRLGDVRCLAVFDDGTGTGPALFAGGQLDIGGQSHYVAKWHRDQWNPVSAPPGSNLPGIPLAFAVHDDGTGAALCAGGNFDRVLKWSADGWLPVGSFPPGYQFPSFQTVRSLASTDGVMGPQLYAAGDFRSGDSVPFAFAARLVGNQWNLLGSGFSGPVRALTASGREEDRALYLGGEFLRVDGVPSTHLARWLTAPIPCNPTP